MWLEETVSRLRSGSSVPLAAFRANTAIRARTRPLAVRTETPSGTGRMPVARLPSQMRAPRASSRSRSPNASRAGWTVAASGTNTPARNTGESQRPRACSAVCASTDAPSTASTPVPPSCAGAVETTSSPPLRYHASTPSASHQAPIASTVARAAAAHASPAASPNSRRSAGSDRSTPVTKPPLRPLGPWPQRPASSTTTLRSGSAASRCHAVHSPV